MRDILFKSRISHKYATVCNLVHTITMLKFPKKKCISDWKAKAFNDHNTAAYVWNLDPWRIALRRELNKTCLHWPVYYSRQNVVLTGVCCWKYKVTGIQFMYNKCVSKPRPLPVIRPVWLTSSYNELCYSVAS